MVDDSRGNLDLAGRVLLVSAHPDDETFSFSAHLPRLREHLTLVHVTDGAPRSLFAALNQAETWRRQFAEGRRRELLSAMAVAGIREEQCIDLRIADQEAALQLVTLTHRIAELVRDLRPAFLVTHPFEGGHPDHDACAFAAFAAHSLLQREAVPAPTLIEFTSYHRWNGTLRAFEFLPNGDTPVRTVALTEQERRRKSDMIARYVSQSDALSQFPITLERYRVAPRYDFTAAPHAGKLHYETFPSGMTSDRWTELARAALRALDLEQ